MCKYLNVIFGIRWIEHYGPVPCTFPCPNLSRFNFFFHADHLMSLVYKTPVDTDENVSTGDPTFVAATRVREMSDIFRNIGQSFYQRCKVCITVGRHNFKQLLQYYCTHYLSHVNRVVFFGFSMHVVPVFDIQGV